MRFNTFTSTLVTAAATLGAVYTSSAQAATQSVNFGQLVASATLDSPLALGDSVFVDTLVTNEAGALSQSVSFEVGAGVGSFSGAAAWEVDAVGPRLVGVNIDLLDAGNNVVASDTFTGLFGSFAISSLTGSLTPGFYTLRATGNAVRDASLDISLTMLAPVPEPGSLALLLAGLAGVGVAARRRLG